MHRIDSVDAHVLVLALRLQAIENKQDEILRVLREIQQTSAPTRVYLTLYNSRP